MYSIADSVCTCQAPAPKPTEWASCRVCGEPFERLKRRNGARQVCSHACRRRTRIIVCPSCGQKATARPGSMFCSKTCANKKKHVQTATEERCRTCKHCGKAFLARQRSSGTFCSRQCRMEWQRQHSCLDTSKDAGDAIIERAERYWTHASSLAKRLLASMTPRLCAECGKPFMPTSPRHVICSKQCCHARAVRAQREKLGIGPRACAWCGKMMSVVQPGPCAYCSDACRNSGYRKVKRKGRSMYRVQRRMRMRGNAGYVHRVDPQEIYERDGCQCGICGESIDLRLEHPHPLSASLDHVVPLARGGCHTRDNLQAAHFICNVRKGAEVPTGCEGGRP